MRNNNFSKVAAVSVAALLGVGAAAGGIKGRAVLASESEAGSGLETAGAKGSNGKGENAKDGTVVLRVCNWEEYIDLGDWDEDELIELENCDIFGENPLYEDFEEWYYEEYGVKVRVEYSCFGTNEELYNMLTIGDVYDLVCPSDYMIMKLMAEGALIPYSEAFLNEEDTENYYVRGAAPFIKEAFAENKINGEAWDRYAACYMWGVTGMLYNPEEVSRQEASTWTILNNDKFFRQITVKDNVRDTMFAAMGAIKADKLLSTDFINNPNYHENLKAEMNDVSPETIAELQEYIQAVRGNVYSFESDSGKADMITGKVLANLQWSGDAVYAMDQAEEDDYFLEYAIPDECTNMWFDGWVMLKKGIEEDSRKQQAAEAFVNYLSMPENAVRNMYYIGYSSAITGGEYDDTVFQYIDWTYGVEEDDKDESSENESENSDDDDDEEALALYNVGYYFSGNPEDENYVIVTTEDQTRRQLYAQYPPKSAIDRSAIMWYFDDEANARVNQMWINVRCFNVKQIPAWLWIIIGLAFTGAFAIIIRTKLVNRKYM